MATYNFTTTEETFTLIVDGNTRGTWGRVDEIDSEFSLTVRDNKFTFSFTNPFLSDDIEDTDTIQIDGEAVTGTFREKIATLKDDALYASSSGGTATLQETLDEGSVLDKANLIDAAGFDFEIDNVGFGQIQHTGEAGVYSSVFVDADISALEASDGGANTTAIYVEPTGATLTKSGQPFVATSDSHIATKKYVDDRAATSIILISPDLTQWEVTVDNSGVLTTTEI